MEIGYNLSSEEHRPADLVRNAARAEEVGFSFALISDHVHPWIDEQGQSPFVWTVIGGIAQATERLRLGTGVTCPTVRIHQAIIAQATATAGAMMEGRFFLGLGTGENLNEHVLGHRWPSADTRFEMLEEAIEVIRALWEGGNTNHHGRFYDVENARLYTLPERAVPIMVAASGSRAAELAGRLADGVIATSPDTEVIDAFDGAGGTGKERIGSMKVCWASSEDEARKTAHRVWPNAGIRGELGQELPLPRHFEQAAQMVTVDDVAETVVCGPDPERHLAKLREYVDAGFEHVYVHQIGPDQDGFFDFYERQVLPKL